MSNRFPSHIRAHRRGEEGVALMLVLLFIVLMMALVVDYCYEAEVDASFATSAVSDFQAYQAAKSGVAKALGLLAEDIMGPVEQGSSAAYGQAQQQFRTNANGQTTAVRTGQRSDGLTSQTGEQAGLEVCDSFLDPVPWAEGITREQINDAFMSASISDEYGKINLNALVRDGEKPNEAVAEVLRAFFEARGMDVAVVDSLIDWMDYDEDTTESGAESDYYSSLTIPYGTRNGPMQSIEELLLIKGVTIENYFGSGDEGQLPLNELLTVHGDPRGRVNINTAAPATLEALFLAGEGGDTGVVEEIISMRDQEPFQSPQDLTSLGIAPAAGAAGKAATSLMTVRSNSFRIYGDGQVEGVRVRIEAYVWRNPMGLDGTSGMGGINDNGILPGQQNTQPNQNRPGQNNNGNNSQSRGGRYLDRDDDAPRTSAPQGRPSRGGGGGIDLSGGGGVGMRLKSLSLEGESKNSDDTLDVVTSNLKQSSRSNTGLGGAQQTPKTPGNTNTNTNAGTAGLGQDAMNGMGSGGMGQVVEMFKILEWRVIR